MFSYELSPEAFADLLDIADYTRVRWGMAQVTKYRDQLEQCAEALATGKGALRTSRIFALACVQGDASTITFTA